MQVERVAIVQSGKDIGRIIPFNIDSSGDYEFKISFLNNDYEVDMYKFLSLKPVKFEVDDIAKWEISYHRASGIKPTVIRLKEKKNKPDYKPLPLVRLVDPTVHTEFPLPFMKIEVPPNPTRNNYNPNPKEHVAFDMEDCNVAEFFLTYINYNFENFMNKWPAISLRLMIASFEFFATNNLLTDENKYRFFLPLDGHARRAGNEFALNNDMKFVVNVYRNPELTGDKIKVTFIENEFAEALLGLAPIGYQNEQGKVEMFPAYKEDLQRNNTMSSDEKRKWEYRFNKMREKLDREITKEKQMK